MTIELGALALRLTTVGGADLLRELTSIDGQAKAVDRSVTRAGVAGGEAFSALAPKAQRAAAAMGSVATAASAVIPEMQGVASAAAIAETSLAGALSTVPISAWVIGIGTAVTALTALVGWMRNAADVPPPGNAWKQHIDNLKVLNSAEAEYNARRKERLALDEQVKQLATKNDEPSATDLAAKQGAAFDTGVKARLTAAQAAADKAREIENAAQAQLVKVRSEQLAATREIIITGETSNAEAALTIQRASIAEQEALAGASYQRGTTSLQQYYATRRSLVQQGADAEIAALKAKDRELATRRPTDNPDDIVKRDLERGRIRAQITAAEIQSETQLANIRREEAQATATAIATEVSWLVALGAAHRAANADKLRAVALEAELRDVVRDANRPLAERLEKMQKIAALQQAGLGLGLGPTLGGVKNTSGIDVGKITLPASVQQQLDALTPRPKLTVELTLADRKLKTMESLKSQLNASFADLGVDAGFAFGSALAQAITTSLTPGSGHTFLENFGNVLLQGLGSILVQMGTELMVTGAALVGLLPFLSNPFTSGPAMIGAGLLITAAGAALGAIATNNSGHRTGGGGSSGVSSSAATPPIQVPLGPRAAPVGSQGYSVTSPRTSVPSGRLGSMPQPMQVNVMTLGRFTDDEARKLAAAVDGTRSRGRG